MFDIDPFQEKVRPTMLPPQIDPRSKKLLEVEDGTHYYSVSAGQTFSEVARRVESTLNRSFNVKNAGMDSKDLVNYNEKKGRQILGQRQVSKIYEGMSLLPQNILANADQLNSTFNFERVKDADYVYLPGVLKPQYEPTGDAESTETIEDQVYSQMFYDLVGEDPGKQSTSPHNLNLFHGIGSNPIKEGDTENYQRFQKSPYFSALHDQSMTPRNILEKLDPKFWAMINDGVTAIEDTNVSALPLDKLNKFKNPYGKNHFGLNWDNVAEPYTDTKSNTFDITANFHTIVSSQLWTSWGDSQIFSFVNRLWESSTRVDDVMREVIGKASDAPITETAVKAAGKSMLDVAADNEARSQAMIDNIDKWWTNVGHSLNEAEILPFGLLASFAPLMQTMKNWGNWADDIESKTQLNKKGDSYGFKEQMISGYLNHAMKKYVFTKFQGNSRVTASMIGAENAKLGQAIYSDLIAKGYLDSGGKITSKFDPSDPNFALTINFSEGEKTRVRDVLRQASVGAFSLDIQDKTQVGGLKRSDIRVPAADGSMKTLPELIDLLKVGTTPYDRVKNAQMVYHTLFDMHSVMTGLDIGNQSNGALLFKSEGARVKVNVSTDGTWKEWDGKESWVQKKGPVSLLFDTKEEATAFKDQIRVVMALLEPVVGTFGPDVDKEGGLPFRMLVDNSGSIDSVNMITDKSSNYRLSVDTLYDRDLFETDSWKKAADRLQSKVVRSVAVAMFGRNASNAMARNEHREKRDDYEVAKEEYEMGEVQRLVKEMEAQNQQRQEEQRMIQKAIEERIRREAEDNKRANEQRRNRQAEEKKNQKDDDD